METDGHPVVYAEIGDGESTLLSYGHYDVQPPEPLELWESDPFEPTVRDGGLFARGVADDKGDVLARIQALRLYQEEHGPLPFKLKFLIEGEEEIGSPNLAPFVRENADLLSADACLWEGSMKDEAGRPMIFCGTKGMAYVELRARGASHDLHSMYGGIAPNPAWRLVQALRTIKDENGEITLDGLDALADDPSEKDLEAIDKHPLRRRRPQGLLGRRGPSTADLTGEEALREMLLRPTANIAGIQSGYTGPGSKTIVPSEAFVKMDFRLVSGQSPGPVLELIRSPPRKARLRRRRGRRPARGRGGQDAGRLAGRADRGRDVAGPRARGRGRLPDHRRQRADLALRDGARDTDDHDRQRGERREPHPRPQRVGTPRRLLRGRALLRPLLREVRRA